MSLNVLPLGSCRQILDYLLIEDLARVGRVSTHYSKEAQRTLAVRIELWGVVTLGQEMAVTTNVAWRLVSPIAVVLQNLHRTAIINPMSQKEKVLTLFCRRSVKGLDLERAFAKLTTIEGLASLYLKPRLYKFADSDLVHRLILALPQPHGPIGRTLQQKLNNALSLATSNQDRLAMRVLLKLGANPDGFAVPECLTRTIKWRAAVQWGGARTVEILISGGRKLSVEEKVEAKIQAATFTFRAVGQALDAIEDRISETFG